MPFATEDILAEFGVGFRSVALQLPSFSPISSHALKAELEENMDGIRYGDLPGFGFLKHASPIDLRAPNLRHTSLPVANHPPQPMKIKAIVHPAEEGGYWVEVPALPGCFTEGETINEVMVKLEEAIFGWLDVADRREEIYHNTKAAQAEQQAGTLKFSSDINELKQLMEEDSSV